MPNYQHPSYQISGALSLIYKSGLTTTSGGNISMRGDNGNIWITPGAIDKGNLTENDIIKVKTDGSYEGLHKPSSELPFHLAIYRARPDIGAIIHAHPPALVSFSIVRKLPDTSVIPQAKFLCGKVGYAPYKMPGSEELGASIATEFLEGSNAVIMENHGTVVGGDNLSDAFMRFETLEFCAKTIIRAGLIGGAKVLNHEEIGRFENRGNIYPVFEHNEPSAEEKFLRHKLCEYIARACRQGLMISSYGTISARLNENSFLINPTNINRRHIDLEDLVLINEGKREQNKVPSRAVTLHTEIYKKHPEIDCIISTQSPNTSAYCVARKQMDTRTIPESYIMLEDIPMMPYGCQYGGGKELVSRIGKHVPILLIENDSVLVTGKSILETFDRLEVAEFSANSLIDSHAIGELQPIKRHEIQELKDKFLIN